MEPESGKPSFVTVQRIECLVLSAVWSSLSLTPFLRRVWGRNKLRMLVSKPLE